MQKEYTLTSQNVDIISEEIGKFLKEKKQSKEDIIKTRLNVETALLYWLENGLAGETFTVEYRKRFVRCAISLVLKGRCCDPLQNTDAEIAGYMSELQGNLGLATSFKYIHGKNIYSVKLPLQSMGNITKIGVAIIASVITWQLSMFLPKEIVAAINANVIDPTFGMIMGLVKAVATFLIFFNVCSAISSMGDLTTLSKLGKGLFKRAQIYNVFWLIIGTLIGIFAFGTVNFSGGLTLALLGDIYKMVLGIVPQGLLDPFVSGNTLQVLFLAVCTGILLLMLDRENGDLSWIFKQCNALLMNAISYFCVVVPVIIYLSLTGILLSGDFSDILGCWKILAIGYAAGILVIFADTLWSALENHFNIKQHFMRVMPVTLLAYTTASTAACIPLMTKTLEEEGVEDAYKDFALPFSQTIVKVGEVVGFPIAILGLLMVYNQNISVSSLILNMFSYLLLAQTLPPVPGGGISVMTLLVLQAGLPKEAVATYLTLDLFFDMLETCCSKTAIMNNVFACAKKEGKLQTKSI